MFHLDNTSGVPEMPEVKDPQSNTPRWFGESESQGGISWPGADWFNMVQAELLNLLAAAEITPNKKTFDQLSKAVGTLGDSGFRTDLAQPPGAGYSGFDVDLNYPKFTLGRQQTNAFCLEQDLSFYYDQLGNWDDALFQAQCNVAIKNFSPRIKLPAKVMDFQRPILTGRALGDAIHAAYPELNFYDPITDTYKKTWPLILLGTRLRWADGAIQDGVGSQIVFSGCENQRDYTWQNAAAIYGGPTNPYDRKNLTAVSQLKWFDTMYLEDLNVRCLNQDGTRFGKVHGIVSLSGKSILKNVLVYQFYGAGIYLDWNFEPIVDGCAVIGCGRMADALPGPGITDDFITLGRTDRVYQTYAPFHINYSPAGSDNSNFISVRDLHLEDNYYAALDVIVSGDSSPARFYDVHFECDPTGLGAVKKKWTIGSGQFGVRYFGQDTESGFDSTSTPYTTRGGFSTIHNVTGYSANYEGFLALKGSSACVASSCYFPNTGNVEINGRNAAARLVASKCSFGNIVLTGGNSLMTPLKLTDCSLISLTASYIYGYKLENTEISGAITITSPLSNIEGGFHHSNVTAASISAVVNYGGGDINLTSTSMPSNLACYFGHIELIRYAYYNTITLGGAK